MSQHPLLACGATRSIKVGNQSMNNDRNFMNLSIQDIALLARLAVKCQCGARAFPAIASREWYDCESCGHTFQSKPHDVERLPRGGIVQAQPHRKVD